MGRSVVSSVALVACLAVLFVAVPGTADTISINSATANWLNAWIAAIPNLQTVWMNPVVCARSGIECDSASNTLSIRLDAITSSGFNFIGTLPELASNINGDLLQVSEVSVRGKTRITGTVPASWSRISKLKKLDVSQTKLSGSIPDALGTLSKLVTADFSNSYFCYNMPNWNSTGMPRLVQAVFNNNNLRGTFASSWSTFASSLSLNIRGNKLCGCMPQSWTSQNLIAAATAMDAATVNGCTRVCTPESLNYCPSPNTVNGAAAQVASLSAALVAVAVAVVSFVY
jgi:hypothetical protein